MADRVIDRDATLLIDIPGNDLEDVTITVRDSIDATLATTQPTSALGDGRYTYLVPAAFVARQGLYTAEWTNSRNGAVLTQTVSIGRNTPAALTKYDLRWQVAKRAIDAYEGYVTFADDSTLTDDLLIGGSGNFRGWWVVLDPSSAENGKFRRVMDFNGSALILNTPYLDPPETGTRYCLMNISPMEVDRAVNTALAEVAQVARVAIDVSGVTLVINADGSPEADVPAGIRYISAIYGDDVLLLDSDWDMKPSRRVTFSSATTANSLTFVGIRSLTPPLWEDSTLDIEPGVVIARACQLVHASRAASAGVDINEHMRRQMMAGQEFEGTLRRVSGRLASGSRAVIE